MQITKHTVKSNNPSLWPWPELGVSLGLQLALAMAIRIFVTMLKPVKGFPSFLLEKANGQAVIGRTHEGWKTWLAANL
jgi:hypothetical protein